MKASILIFVASALSAGSLAARKERACTATTTLTFTSALSTTTKTVTVTAQPGTTTSTSATKLRTTSASSSIGTSRALNSKTSPMQSPPTTVATTTKSSTTSTRTNTSARSTETAAPGELSCEDIGNRKTYVGPNGKKWHVLCGQNFTGVSSIVGFSDSIDDFGACMDFCSTVSGARVVNFSENSCNCCGNGGRGIDYLDDADAAYTNGDSS